jgi:hypothetical protein
MRIAERERKGRFLSPKGVSGVCGNSSRNPPEGAIDRNLEKIKMGEASRLGMRPGI